MESHSSPKRRTRRGCLTCRQRKVKCDERPDCCGTCERLALNCTWEPRAAERQRRSRRSRACDRCRDKKLKCLDVESSQGCRNCREAGVRCVPPGIVERRPAQPVIRLPHSTESRIQSLHEHLSLLEYFFRGPHRFCFYTFLRRRSYTEMLENDLVPRPLLLVVSATALRCKDPQSSLPDQWADESRNLVVLDVFSRMSTTNLQTLLLLQRYEWHRGSHLSACILAGLAVRLTSALQLYRDPSEARSSTGIELPIPVIETRRRLMWSCFTMDSIPDAGDRPTQPSVDPETIRAQLPGPEASFEEGLESKEGYHYDTPSRMGDPSMSAYLIRMTLLRLRILQYSNPFYPQSIAKPHTQAPWTIESDFYKIQASLEELQAVISRDFPLHRTSLPTDPASLTAFFTLHAMLHAAYTDLLRTGIHANPRGDFPISKTEAKSFFNICRRRRIEHAKGIAEVISMCMHSKCEQHDPFMAICSCLALRIIIAERWDDGRNLLDLADPSIAELLNDCRNCAIKTAEWSRPIRRLLFAVSKLVFRHGYELKLSESSLGIPPQDPSRAGTPGLQIYGTAGMIRKAREEQDLESTASPTDIRTLTAPATQIPAAETSTVATVNSAREVVEVPGPNSAEASDLTIDQGVSSLQDLQVAYNWSNGVYDRNPTLMDIGWTDFDLQWSYGQDSTAWDSTNEWDVQGMP